MAIGGVPNTTTFTLQNVVDAVAGPQTSLLDCVADADPSAYDPAYYTAPATSMLEFRNYEEAVAPSTLSVSPTTRSVPVSGGNAIFSVSSNESWSVSQVTGGTAWTISPSTGTNNGSFTIIVPSGGETVYEFKVQTTTGTLLQSTIFVERAG